MLAHVIQQVLFARERLRAEVTPVRRFSRVPHNVVGEVLLARERLAADFALERRIVGVRAQMIG